CTPVRPLLLAPPRPTLFPYTTLFRSSARKLRTSTTSAFPSVSCMRVAPRRTVISSATRRLPISPARRCSPRQASVRQCLCGFQRSEEHTSELQSRENLVCRLLLEKKK